MDAEKKIVAIILEHFPNGIRDDFIDTNKVLKLYRTKYAEEVSLKKIADVIRARGIEDGGRFYFVSAEDVKSIKWLFDEILETNSIVYYSVVRVKHADFFVRRSVFSPKILRKVLSKKGDYFYSKDFCATDKSTRLEYEVEKIFRARGNSLTLGELQEKFSYVPPEKISVLLDDARKYLKINSGKFFLVSEIHFDEEEIRAARQKIFSVLDASESASLEDCDLSSTFALNLRKIFLRRVHSPRQKNFQERRARQENLGRRGRSHQKFSCRQERSVRRRTFRLRQKFCSRSEQ